MAHPLILRKSNFFYPIGNTPAIYLTKDLPPEEDGRVLLLGCGDPRSILFTCLCSEDTAQILDFTCCDVEAAVLARNVLLFSLAIEDGQGKKTQQIWNIFYHFFLDAESLKLLVSHCQILLTASADIEAWKASKYSPFLKMCSANTLVELRKYWSLYVKAASFSAREKAQFKNKYEAGIQWTRKEKLHNFEGLVTSAGRCAGPVAVHALEPLSAMFKHYWTHGVVHTKQDDIERSTLVNPTLAYSSNGERFSVHHGTDPIEGFHLASAFVPLKGKAYKKWTASSIVATAQAEFSTWCEALRSLVSKARITIRLFAGDVFPFCEALQAGSLGLSPRPGRYLSRWNEQEALLDGGDYNTGSPPYTFNVIDTSNLVDHLGMINVLIMTAPLLAQTPESVLYTETLISIGRDPITEFVENLCCDIPTISVLLGITPISFLYPVKSHSSTLEILFQAIMSTNMYHERVAWKVPSLGDSLIEKQSSPELAIAFEPDRLGRLLFAVYLTMFRDENWEYRMRSLGLNAQKAVNETTLINVIRGTFAALLRLVKIRTSGIDWDIVMDCLLGNIEDDKTLFVGLNYYQDFLTQLHVLGVHTTTGFNVGLTRGIGCLKNWNHLPLVVAVTLVVPRAKLKPLANMDRETLGTPMLQCEVRGLQFSNSFSSIHACFGRLVTTGLQQNLRLVMHRDEKGLDGDAPLIVSFWVPTRVLLFEPDAATVLVKVRQTPATMMTLTRHYGMDLTIFETEINSTANLFISPERPNMTHEIERSSAVARNFGKKAFNNPSQLNAVLDTGCKSIISFCRRIDIIDPVDQESFSKAVVSASQVSPCVLELSLGHRKLLAQFPFPIDGARHRLRLARKSMWLEIIVALSTPGDSAGYSTAPFPVVRSSTDNFMPFNLHRVPLSLLPVISLTRPSMFEWINSHVALAFSDRERAVRTANADAFGGSTGDALIDLKESLFTMLMTAAGQQTDQPNHCFGLADPDSGGVHTLIFVSNVLLDTVGSTLVLDVDMVPLSLSMVTSHAEKLFELQSHRRLRQINVVGQERRYWKQLLVAAAERCRSWAHSDGCEYRSRGVLVSYEDGESPLCSCGKGKVGPHSTCPRVFQPYATRGVISQVFAVSWLETVGGRDVVSKAMAKTAPTAPASTSAPTTALAPSVAKPQAAASKGSTDAKENMAACGTCQKTGKTLLCARCRQQPYCSVACQRLDWRRHKVVCKTAA